MRRRRASDAVLVRCQPCRRVLVAAQLVAAPAVNVNVVCVDFDGVLHDPFNRTDGYRMGQPISGAPEALGLMKRMGYWVVVLTCRHDNGNFSHVEKWLEYFHIPYDEVTNVKPDADWYVDDRGIRFEDWTQALNDMGFPPEV